MIERFMDWCYEVPCGMLYFVLLGTFLCCTGLILPIVAYDLATSEY